MPIFWTEERGAARLPYTEIRVGDLTLCFRGRFGSKLREAVNHLEQQQRARHGEGERTARAEGAAAAGAEEAEADEEGHAMKIEGFANRTTKEGGCLVLVDGKELPLAPSLRLRNHSPTGFNWGYSGSGPAQLALALLLWSGAGREEAQALYQSFKAQHVAGWPGGQDFSIEIDLVAWRLGAQAARQALENEPRMSER